VTGGYDLVDEGRPIVGPFLLEDGHEDKVQLIDESPLRFQTLLRARTLNYEIDHKISYP